MHHTARVHLVHMGDSITEGQYIDPSVRWTSLIERRLAEKWGQNRFVSFNRGISGETTRMGLERFPTDVQNLRPDVMTLQFGSNDCNCWETDGGVPRVSAAAFSANMTEMIHRARVFGAKRIVMATNHCTLRGYSMTSGEVYEEANARYSELSRAVARENNVELCDIRASFEEFDDGELGRLLLPYPDHLHLSIEGNEVYAEIIWPYVEAAMAEFLDSETRRETETGAT